MPVVHLWVPPLFRRRSPRGAGEAVHPEAAAVLRPLRLRFGPPERPKMEGSETGGSERDGGVHHPQQERGHRAHLPRGGSHGQCCAQRDVSAGWRRGPIVYRPFIRL